MVLYMTLYRLLSNTWVPKKNVILLLLWCLLFSNNFVKYVNRKVIIIINKNRIILIKDIPPREILALPILP